jgi:hypothetical protein
VKLMTYHCQRCNKVIAKEDRRRTRLGFLIPQNNAMIQERINEAPRIKCQCGLVTILLKGSL